MTPDKSRLAEAIRACDMGDVVKALDELTGVLHALFETMEEFRTDVVHALRNQPRSDWVTKPQAATATVNDALMELLGCAELNQDDIEEETRELIAKAYTLLHPPPQVAREPGTLF